MRPAGRTRWPTSARPSSRMAGCADRWTFNLGLRFDHQASYLPEETAPQSRFFPDPVMQAATDDLISWNNLSPRLGRHLRPDRLGEDAGQGELLALLLADLHDQDRRRRALPARARTATPGTTSTATAGSRPTSWARSVRWTIRPRVPSRIDPDLEADVHGRVHGGHRARADAQRLAERHVHRAQRQGFRLAHQSRRLGRRTTRP